MIPIKKLGDTITMKCKKITALLLIVIMLVGMIATVRAENATATVDSVTAQLQAIDTLQQMQAKRDQYTTTGSYEYDTTNQALIARHLETKAQYETYVANMFAARTAAKQAYDSLSPEEQAQIDPALVSKLNNELPTVFYGDTHSVTPRNDEYRYEVVKGSLGLGYEVSGHRISKEIPQTFVVVDTSNGANSWTPDGKYEAGKSNYEVTYCCDFETPLKWGTDYRRVNLEDSVYFGDEAARHIRAIVLNSYPYLSVEEMKDNLIAKGMKQSYVDSLSRSDIISAVQMAIWRYSNSKKFETTYWGYTATLSMQKHIGLYYTLIHDYSNEIWDWFPGKKQKTFDAQAEYRINNLAYFLCCLDGVDAEEDRTVISDIQVGRVDMVPISEGYYNIGLHITLNEGCDAGGAVKLKVISSSKDASGNVIQTAAKTITVGSEKEYTLTINAKYGDTIDVVAEGTQTLKPSVYFYEAEGGYLASQSLVGVAEGTTPVYAAKQFTFEEDIEAGLRIYKKSSDDKTPISDITFHIYKVNTENGEKLNDSPTAEEIEKYATAENLVGSVVTDVTGYAALELENYNTYLVVEEHNKDKVEKPVDPFYITLPHPVEKEVEGANGIETVVEYLDIVSVYPKNKPTTPPPPPPPTPPNEVVGAFNIIKHDSDNTAKVLSGAKFQVYRPATEDDTTTETLICNGLEVAVVPVKVGEELLVLTTDQNGSAVSPDLECGVYYIKETQAPLGYVRLKEAIAVNVVSKTMQEVAYTYVGNERGILLPETGGFGTPLFLGIGGTLTLFAVILLVTKKRMINS